MLDQSPSWAPYWRLRLPAMLRGPLASAAQIYFVSSPGFGALLLLCLYWSGPALAVGCALGACAAVATAWAVELPAGERAAGSYGFNAALAGAGLGATYQLNLALVLWIVLAGLVTSPLSHALLRLRIPMLTIQFVLIMWLSAAAGPSLGLVATQHAASGCSLAPFSYAFCSLGQASFVGAAPLGMLLWSVLARERWSNGMWALGGAALAWCAATFGPELLPQFDFAGQAGGMGINCALAALALSVHRRRWPWRLAGIALSAALCVACAGYALPYFTLPFVLATWTALALSRGASEPTAP